MPHSSSTPRLTFRLKLLIALLATIAPLLLVTLFVVRREAARQVDVIVQRTGQRATEAFTRIEKIRQEQLRSLGISSANSNRWGSAMLENDTTLLIDNANYELDLTGFQTMLVAFTDLYGEPLAAVVNKKSIDPRIAIAKPLIDRLFSGDTAVFGYHAVGSKIYSIHPVVVGVGEQPTGVVQFGSPIDEETANSLGQALGAEVCFQAGNQCIVSSSPIEAHEFATLNRSLPGASEVGTQLQLRIPLDEVVRPFHAIINAIYIVGIAVLLLAIIIALILSRGMAQPVRALVAATERVARGDYETDVQVHTNDELGTLANAFNEMTHGLLLKEKYKGVLDKVVSRDVADEMLKGEIQLGGEMRTVTTLFADVRGFTAMSEGMDPHDVVTLLNEVMERAEAAVVAEGGVVDKYVGDEIMALFGAPMSRDDDALRAVRAALRIQEEVASINTPVKLGIGINTGNVVAGNMGSARRLNYTVIGAPVNLAARLCSQAEGGQILITESTEHALGDEVETRSLGERMIRGLSHPIELFEVKALARVMALLGSLIICGLSTAQAQRTFDVGPLQIQPTARVDVLGFIPDDRPSWLIPSTSPFVAGRASGFFDIFAGNHIYSLVELRVDRGEAPSDGNLQARVEQAYVRFTPSTKVDANLQIGRFVSPFGNYPQRHHSTSDPLIRPPVMYDYRTMISCDLVPMSNDGFISWKDDPAEFRPLGAPPVWAAPYQLGAMLSGSFSRVNYRLALMNTAPSTEPRVWNYLPDNIDETSYVANVGMQITPELRVSASYQFGAFMDPATQNLLPAGKSWTDYYQRIIGIEASVTRGFVEVRGEYLHDGWEVPNVDEDPIDKSYYLETKVKVAAGAFASARFSAIRFNEIPMTNGQASQWDYNVRRLQFGAGYRLSEALEVRGEMMLNKTASPTDPKDNLFSIQASWELK